MLGNIKAVIFDLDGTLIDSVHVWNQVDIEYLAKRGIALPDTLSKEIEGLSFPETALYFKKKFSLPDTIEEIQKEWIDMVNHEYNSIIKLKDGVKEFLDFLRFRKISLGVATSNYMHLATAVLKNNNILQYFPVIVTTSEVPRDKSYPDIYLETASRLGFDASECIVFEDTLNGLSGAKKAGMKVTGIYDPNGSASYEEIKQASDYTIESYKEIFTKIRF